MGHEAARVVQPQREQVSAPCVCRSQAKQTAPLSPLGYNLEPGFGTDHKLLKMTNQVPRLPRALDGFIPPS